MADAADRLRALADAATPPDHGEETWEQKMAWDRYNEAQAAMRRAGFHDDEQGRKTARGYADALDALALLVALKDGPRDRGYEREKPSAWNQARAVLADADRLLGNTSRDNT
jgi:hypothetical protein